MSFDLNDLKRPRIRYQLKQIFDFCITRNSQDILGEFKNIKKAKNNLLRCGFEPWIPKQSVNLRNNLSTSFVIIDEVII